MSEGSPLDGYYGEGGYALWASIERTRRSGFSKVPGGGVFLRIGFGDIYSRHVCGFEGSMYVVGHVRRFSWS